MYILTTHVHGYQSNVKKSEDRLNDLTVYIIILAVRFSKSSSLLEFKRYFIIMYSRMKKFLIYKQL